MKICVIGGIGSGKSEFLKAAKDLGISVASADEINNKLLESPKYIEKIKAIFPTAVVDDKIDKKTLANIVFNDKNEKEKLNDLAHPLIMQEIYAIKDDPIVIELPLIIESKSEDYFDAIVLIHTPIQKRLARLKNRGLSYMDSLKRIKAQVPEKELKKVSTKIIDNSGTVDELYDKAKKYIQVLIDEEKEN